MMEHVCTRLKDYIVNEEWDRLLLYHQPATTVIALAAEWKKKHPEYRIIVILPAQKIWLASSEHVSILSFEDWKTLAKNSRSLKSWVKGLTENTLIIIDKVHDLIVKKYTMQKYTEMETTQKLPSNCRGKMTMLFKYMTQNAAANCKMFFLSGATIHEDTHQMSELASGLIGRKIQEGADIVSLMKNKISYFQNPTRKYYFTEDVPLTKSQDVQIHAVNTDGNFMIKQRKLALYTGGKLVDLKEQSPKVKRLLHIIQVNTKQVHLVYTSFLKIGVDVVRDSLMANGWVNAKSMKYKIEPEHFYKVFAVWDDDKEKITEIANSVENTNGKHIAVIIGSSNMREGVFFTNIRRIHILDPILKTSEKEQIEGRAICKHVNIHTYKSVPRKNGLVQQTCDEIIQDVITPKRKRQIRVGEQAFKKNALEFSKKKQSNICSVIQTNETTIVHLIDKNEPQLTSNTTGKVVYKTVVIDDDLKETFLKSLRECSERNILVYCSTSSSIKKTKKIQSAINDAKKTPMWFRNVSIVNYAEYAFETMLSIPKREKKPIYRKVINVYASDIEDNKKATYWYEENEFHVIRRRISETHSKLLDDQWWFRWQLAIPSCATGRLMQFNGTCAFNASLNALLLAEKCKRLLIRKWFSLSSKEKKHIKSLGGLEKCLVSTTPLKYMLYMVVYNILVKGEKTIIKQGNWVNELASATKSIIETNSEEQYMDLKIQDFEEKSSNVVEYGNSAQAFDTIHIILSTLFSEAEHQRISCKTTQDDYDLLVPDNIDMYNELVTHKDVFYKRFTRETTFRASILNVNRINPKPNVWTLDTKPMIVDMYLPPNDQIICKLPRTLIINNNSYALYAGLIVLDFSEKEDGTLVSSHAVTGFRCDSQWYIYDSNNYLVETNWQNYSFDTYLKEAAYKYAVNYVYISNLIYVRDD